MNNVKITMLEVQNVKRVKALRIDCGNPLSVIGAKNGQGKTTCLDAIAFALGGERYRPSAIKREGAAGNPFIKVTLNNGMIVERTGKNSSLKITDPAGGKGGQQLLNDFVSVLAIDLPKFLNATESEKAKMLLGILGIGDKLEALEREEKRLYDERHAIGQIADRKKKHAEEMPVFEGVPADLISASTLIKSQQAILAQNGENQRKRDRLDTLTRDEAVCLSTVEDLREKLAKAESQLNTVRADLVTARKTAEELHDESTAELEAQLADIETTNAKITANLDRGKAEDDAKAAGGEYGVLTGQIESVRRERLALLDGAALPLEGLSIEEGKLTFNGKFWDCMSGSEQLRVGTAIAQKMNPKCGFVLIDKAEQFDTETLAEFGKWLESQDLQAIATRVSTGDECSIVIEDGFALGQENYLADMEEVEEAVVGWKPGEF